MPPEVPVIIVGIVWGIRELLPFALKAIREHQISRRPPPLPPPMSRDEMPTPAFGMPRASPAEASGRYMALSERAELAALSLEMRELHAEHAEKLIALTLEVRKHTRMLEQFRAKD